MKLKFRCLVSSLLLAATRVHAAEVEPQPFLAALRRVMDAADYLGSPFSEGEKETLNKCIATHDAAPTNSRPLFAASRDRRR